MELLVGHSGALNVKVKEFNQARVNGGSNYDSLKVGSLAGAAHLLNDNTGVLSMNTNRESVAYRSFSSFEF
eukprot:g859.t1